ncbi:MAG TPA: GAF domain-containing protein, partial [Anaerolineae bacterium]|nr:GAF domain-containing protein [Anaerolineae bacterium]
MLPNFTQFIDLLTGSGALIYHLIVLFTLEAIIGMTIGHARRNGWSPALRRAMIAAIVLLIGRAILMVVALLGQIGIPPNIIVSSAITPPLERYIDLVSLGFLAWVFVPLLLDRAQLGLGFVLGNLVLATIVYATFGLQWYNTVITPNLFYNTGSQETVWQAWSLALAILATLGSFVGREESSGITVTAFALLSIGHLLQLISPVSTSHIAGWVWLAQLATYPLFAIAIYRRVAFGETRDETNLAPTGFDQPSNDTPILEAAQRVANRKDPQLSLIQATTALANAMSADLAAIGLPSLQPGSVELAAIYSPASTPANNPAFTLDSQPSIKRAITRRRPVAIMPGEDQPEMAELFTLMGSHVTGPLLIVPLVDDRVVLGVALFGNPTSNRAWTAADALRARSLCDYLATALTTAKRHETFEHRIDELGGTLRQQEADAAQRRTWFENALQKVQTEALQASTQSQQQQKRITELAALVELHEEQAKQIGSDHGQWQERVDQLTSERTRLASELQEHAQETDRLTQLQSGLEKELKEAQQQIGYLQDALNQRPILAAEPSSILPEEDHQRELVASLVQELRTPMTSI